MYAPPIQTMPEDIKEKVILHPTPVLIPIPCLRGHSPSWFSA